MRIKFIDVLISQNSQDKNEFNNIITQYIKNTEDTTTETKILIHRIIRKELIINPVFRQSFITYVKEMILIDNRKLLNLIISILEPMFTREEEIEELREIYELCKK